MPNSNDIKDLESKVKKTVISAESLKRGSSFDTSKNIINVHKSVSNLAGHVRKVVIRVGDLEKRVQNNSRKITSLKNISTLQGPQIRGTNIGAKLPGGSSQSVDKNIAAITESVSSIAEILAGRKKLADNTAAYDRKKAEQEKRALAESKLEKRFEGLKKVAEKIIAPVKSLLDKILDFFVTIFFGRVVYKLVEWMGDPKNASKVKSIIRFLGDWWPALLGAYILFGNSFGGLIRSTVGIVGRFIFQIGKVAIPQLLKFIRTPLGAGIALFTAGATIPTLLPDTVNEQERKTKDAPGSPQEKIKSLQNQKANLNFFEKLQGKGAEIDEQIYALQSGKTKSYGFSGGGLSSGFVSGEKGVDKVPAMLSDGEFVMSRGAVEKYGVDTLEAMNAAGGGTNKPKIMGGKTYAAGGGLIGNIKDFIKYKIGYDVDKPQTWGKSFGSGLSGFGKGFDFNTAQRQLNSTAKQIGSNLQNLLPNQQQIQQTGSAVYNLAKSKIPTQEEILQTGSNIANRAGSLAKTFNPLAPYGKIISGISDKPFLGENAAIERERKLGLMKPGADSLTTETKKKLADRDAYVKSLYDPEKDKGFMGVIKRTHQNIQNRGLISDPFAALGLKEEGTEKFVEKISGGRIKNLGAKITGLQFAAKGLLGPLGRAFQIDDRGSLGRYLRPAMLEAQKRGHSGVGAGPLGQETYNKLVDDKIANLALGQTSFTVDKSGRAKTKDVFDSNQTAQEYFKQSRQAMKALGNILQGKKATIGEGKNLQELTGLGGAAKAVYETAFKGLSGVLRVNQNTGWGNLRPMGNDIDLGGGFKQTDSRGNVLSPQQIRQANMKKKDIRSVKPPAKPKVKVIRTKADTIGNGKGGGRPSRPKTPNFSATTPGMRSKQETLGLMR